MFTLGQWLLKFYPNQIISYSVSFKYIMRAWSLGLQVRFEQLSILIKSIYFLNYWLFNTGPLIYLALIVGHFTDRCACRLAAQVLLLFHLAVIRGPRLLFECATANITFEAHLKKALEGLSAVYLLLILR
jgi:hypothetical protein